eukprot:CAMPEP_0198145748 /NCGR_PEP_ID=MMETSP1443-20131203/25146_1 /TAXON_ID=186043 /ORGANISM="Entomoneis sp., Strain CCMP2396" /LENGTH=196 /DNA_ID=CAMNT_0043809471 /DNA_START=84 /DNA_END=670 /DNA_ORIENTATION=+
MISKAASTAAASALTSMTATRRFFSSASRTIIVTKTSTCKAPRTTTNNTFVGRTLSPNIRFFSSAESTSSSSSTTATTTTTASDAAAKAEEITVPITFINTDGSEITVQAPAGKHLLDVAHDNNIELEGACGGELACSTCHLIFLEQEDDNGNNTSVRYDMLPEKTEEEEDMLDLAFEIQPTSRLGCQITVKPEYA